MYIFQDCAEIFSCDVAFAVVEAATNESGCWFLMDSLRNCTGYQANWEGNTAVCRHNIYPYSSRIWNGK